MDDQAIFSFFPFELTHTFDIGQRLDVTYSSTDFSNHKIKIAGIAQQIDVVFDFVGDVGNNLYGFTQIVAMAFLINYVLIDTPCSDIIGSMCFDP